jgi:hypothetical protein
MKHPILVLVHGRAQGGNDPAVLRASWLDTLREGLGQRRGAVLDDLDIRFPFYSDALDRLLSSLDEEMPADIRTRGTGGIDRDYLAFQEAMLAEIAGPRLSPAEIDRAQDAEIRERGPLNWRGVLAILRALDGVPGLSGRTVERFTRDVYVYLKVPAIRRAVNDIVATAMPSGKSIVVGHSLGFIIAYDILRNSRPTCNVALLVTVGSPLGLQAIRDALVPIGFPGGVGAWRNALDTRDFVALHPLDGQHFAVRPPVSNYTSVRNSTNNSHGITWLSE